MELDIGTCHCNRIRFWNREEMGNGSGKKRGIKKIKIIKKMILERCRILRAINPQSSPAKRTKPPVKTFSSPKVYNTLTSEKLHEEPLSKL